MSVVKKITPAGRRPRGRPDAALEHGDAAVATVIRKVKSQKAAWRDILARHAVSEAKAGHMAPLIGRVLSDTHLSADERAFLRELLEANDGRKGKAETKRINDFLAEQVADAAWEEEREKARAEGRKPSKKVVLGKISEARGLSRASAYRKIKRKRPNDLLKKSQTF